MTTTTLKSPTTGKTLVPVAEKTTTPTSDATGKRVSVIRTYVEVIVSDSRFISQGSQWGHAAISIDGKVYSRAHPRYFTTTYDDYVKRNSYRDSIGLVLWLSSREKEIVQAELERRVKANADYSIFDNSCSTNVADVLEMVGILAHDPRNLPTPVTPAELLNVLSKSNRLVKRIAHPKHENN
jgi:hypothetical protein